MTRVGTVALSLALAILALSAGLYLGGHPDKLPESLRDAFVADSGETSVRTEVLDEIQDDFYKSVNREKLENASLKGMVRALKDPFSHYLTPKEADKLEESLQGRFEGVGMSVEQNKRGLLVLNVFGGSPAQRAGIKKNDLITAVNGRSLAGVNSEVATSRIKGPSGTTVRLEVVTPKPRRKRTMTLKRERIEVPVTRTRIVERGGEKIAVIQLLTFSEGSHGLLQREIEKAERKGAKGIVLDLRGNGGGLLEEAVLVTSLFVPEGKKVVSVRGRARKERVEEARGGAIETKTPMVVLVDRGSASASEIVAGALRDLGRARLVGTRTFGKGLVQEPRPLSNGGVLSLTVANYYLPGGKTIGRKGLSPQVKAKDDPKTDRDEALPKALRTLQRELR